MVYAPPGRASRWCPGFEERIKSQVTKSPHVPAGPFMSQRHRRPLGGKNPDAPLSQAWCLLSWVKARLFHCRKKNYVSWWGNWSCWGWGWKGWHHRTALGAAGMGGRQGGPRERGLSSGFRGAEKHATGSGSNAWNHWGAQDPKPECQKRLGGCRP